MTIINLAISVDWEPQHQCHGQRNNIRCRRSILYGDVSDVDHRAWRLMSCSRQSCGSWATTETGK